MKNNIQDIQSLVKNIKNNNKNIAWKHQYNLGNNIYTRPLDKDINSPANAVNKWKRILDLVGKDHLYEKKIIDIGCSEGYFAFEASKIAESVMGVDLDPIRIERANLIKDFKMNKNCQFFCKDCKDLPKKDFNLSFALGLLHRIQDPIGFLKAITDISDELIIEYKCFRSSKPIAHFAGGKYKVNKFSKLYFVFSISCLESVLNSFGFDIIKKEKLSFFSNLKYPRHMVYAKRKNSI